MAASLPGDATWAGGYNTPQSVAEKMLAHRKLLNDKTKLTWDESAEPIYSTHKMVGKVNLSAPYIRFGTRLYGKYYWLQNGKWYLGNGTETTLEVIAEKESTDPQLVSYMFDAEKAFIEDASRRDPNICKHCLKYRSKSPDDYMRHVMQSHPDEAMRVAGIKSDEKAEPVVAKPAVECCGKSFRDARGLSAHKKFSKVHKTVIGA